MEHSKVVTVYCSSYNVGSNYQEPVREFARAASANHYKVLCGGSIKGLMGVLIDEMLSLDGDVVGVIPDFMRDIEIEHKGLKELIITPTMSRRKEILREGSDVVIAFPGGLGTLDELIETLVLKRLGRYYGDVVLYDVDGFWDPFMSLLESFSDSGVLDKTYHEQLIITRSIGDLITIVNESGADKIR